MMKGTQRRNGMNKGSIKEVNMNAETEGTKQELEAKKHKLEGHVYKQSRFSR